MLTAKVGCSLLSKLAWETFSQGEYFFKQDKAEKIIGEYIRNLPGVNTDEEALRLDSEAVLKSIESQHGLLVERAKGIYSFSHLSFQEYFAAREIVIVRQSSEEVLEELVSHLFEQHWREIFSFAIAMSPNIDRLACLMKKRIDLVLVDKSELQNYLKWLNRKASTVKIQYSSEEVETIQRTTGIYVSKDNSLSRIAYLNLDFYKNFGIYNCLPKTKDLDLNLNLFLDYTLYHTINRYSALNINHILILAEEPAPQMYKVLLKLKQRMSGKNFTNNEEITKWWHDFQIAMINYRDIGHFWLFSEEQKVLLEKFYKANQFLTQCLHQDCYVSPEVRQEIEETLLLPIAEIEKHKNK